MKIVKFRKVYNQKTFDSSFKCELEIQPLMLDIGRSKLDTDVYYQELGKLVHDKLKEQRRIVDNYVQSYCITTNITIDYGNHRTILIDKIPLKQVTSPIFRPVGSSVDIDIKTVKLEIEVPIDDFKYFIDDMDEMIHTELMILKKQGIQYFYCITMDLQCDNELGYVYMLSARVA